MIPLKDLFQRDLQLMGARFEILFIYAFGLRLGVGTSGRELTVG
jgi:hypothetical protein